MELDKSVRMRARERKWSLNYSFPYSVISPVFDIVLSQIFEDNCNIPNMDLTKTLKAVILLDTEGQRILGKYFDDATNSKQLERKLYVNTKSHKIRDEVLVIGNMLILHRFVTDLHLYVIGGKNENPLILDAVLRCLVEVITSLVNKSVERKKVIDHMSQIILALDEICDSGMVLETDPNLVYQRVTSKDDLAEQSMAQRLQNATEHIRFPWIRS